MNLWINAVALGLAYAASVLGVFITFRILAFPDLTVDVVGGHTLRLPRDLAGSYAVVLIYRGSWCRMQR